MKRSAGLPLANEPARIADAMRKLDLREAQERQRSQKPSDDDDGLDDRHHDKGGD